MPRSMLCRGLPLLLFCFLASTDRALAARAVNCQTLYSKCASCATTTKTTVSGAKISYLACKACKGPAGPLANAYTAFTNFGVNPPKSTCKCAAGYYNPGQDMTRCEVCPKGNWCPGVSALVNGVAVKTLCTTGLTTVTTGATTAASCVTLPGYGFNTATSSASVCALGTYSAGGKRAPCTACPAGLVTAGSQTNSINKCAAPPGMYYVNATRQALPCPKGTFKTDVSQAPSCTPCPTGITTAATKSISPSQCNRAVTAGFYAATENGQLVAKPCEKGKYSSNGQACIDCGQGLTTASEGATNADACLAPPGFGWDSNRSPETYQCPSGWFKAGWNKLPCTSCGTNVLTDVADTNGLGLSADQCFIPPGSGSQIDATGKLVARQCLLGKYGAAQPIYGIQPHPCQPCPENTVTCDQIPISGCTGPVLFDSPDSCVAKPGYCWANRVASKAPVGYYKAGYNQEDCTACGTGLTTVAAGSADPADCVPLPGWEKETAGSTDATPCWPGWYSAGGDSAVKCSQCPYGSTTEYPMSNDISQCSLCSPGFGGDPDNVANRQNQCIMCDPATYSPGGTDNACIPCQEGETSPPGASDSSDCFDEFGSYGPYDMVTTPSNAWVDVAEVTTPSTTASSAEECEAACKNTDRCQYYIFRTDQDPEDYANNPKLGDGCWFKMAPATGAADTYTAFKLWTGDYVVWEAAADEYPTGEDNKFDSNPTSPQECLEACDDMASCVAVFVKSVPATGWECYRVDGDFSTTGTVVSAVKAHPYRINLDTDNHRAYPVFK